MPGLQLKIAESPTADLSIEKYSAALFPEFQLVSPRRSRWKSCGGPSGCANPGRERVFDFAEPLRKECHRSGLSLDFSSSAGQIKRSQDRNQQL
jgi:hypothetical protein